MGLRNQSLTHYCGSYHLFRFAPLMLRESELFYFAPDDAGGCKPA
jgi:hypothetical protein